MGTKLKVYSYVQKLWWPSTFSGRLLFIAFLGFHMPLLAIIMYVLPGGIFRPANLPILFIALAATATGTVVTLSLLAQMLQPLNICLETLENYKNDQTLPELPTHYTDEAGRLMANLQLNITHLDSVLNVKTKLLAILSHDARSPLNSILMAQELIKEQVAELPVNTEILREYTTVIETGVNHQMELLNNVLTLSRLDSDNQNIELVETSLHRLLQKVQYHNKLHLKSKNLTFSIRLNTDDLTILVDEIKFKSVLNNLVQNAIKFTPVGGCIKIETHLSPSALKIMVSDTGTGISPEVEPHLFKANVQSSRKGTQQEKGTGLGLWICKTFTELNKGTISYQTETGQGTTFTLTFDAKKTVIA